MVALHELRKPVISHQRDVQPAASVNPDTACEIALAGEGPPQQREHANDRPITDETINTSTGRGRRESSTIPTATAIEIPASVSWLVAMQRFSLG
jgi:hypothetical protein